MHGGISRGTISRTKAKRSAVIIVTAAASTRYCIVVMQNKTWSATPNDHPKCASELGNKRFNIKNSAERQVKGTDKGEGR